MTDLPNHPALRGEVPVLAAVPWVDGKPRFPPSFDPQRCIALGIRRRCMSCGHPINSHAYRIVVGAPASEPVHTENIVGPPLHRSCAFYAAGGPCPFLRYRISRRRETDHTVRGHAAIVGFRDYGIAFHPPTPLQTTAGEKFSPVSWAYFNIAEEVPFRTSADIAGMYEESVTADAKLNFTSNRLYWTGTTDDQQRLDAMVEADARTIYAWHKQGAVTNVAGHTYQIQHL
jgi:hypothetical protein